MTTRELNTENATRRYLDPDESDARKNSLLTIAVIGACLVSLASIGVAVKFANQSAHARVVVLSSTPTGDMMALPVIDAADAHPTPKTMQYFANQIVTSCYSRVRATINDDFFTCQDYLSKKLAQDRQKDEQETHWIATFIGDGTPETRVEARRVRLETQGDCTDASRPCKLTVDYTAKTGQQVEQESVDLYYVISPAAVTSDMILTNPLGIQILEKREQRVGV